MRLSEAYDVLGLKEGASEDDVKKRSRELMKKFHPDVNKAPDAEAKFKQVNEAVERIKSGGQDDTFVSFNVNGGVNPFGGDLGSMFDAMFGTRSRRQQSAPPPMNVQLNIKVTFKDAVLGSHQTIKYTVNDFCETCDGSGSTLDPTQCNVCNGRGMIEESRHSGNVWSTTRRTCPKCNGRVKVLPCQTCMGARTAKRERVQQVAIPAGVADGMTLRLRNAGNAVIDPLVKTHTDVLLTVSVIPDENGLRLVGDNIVFEKEITLLQALTGVNIVVPTILGEREVVVRPMSKNGDSIVISGCGVASRGNQIVNLNVRYPSDVTRLISLLSEESFK